MTNPLAQDLGGVVRLFHETSGDTWAALGTRVVSDPEFPVLRGHVADCVEDDDAAFIAACHEFFRTHSDEIAGALALADRINADEVEVAVAQAVEFAEYVERQAKGAMVDAAKRFLSHPYAQQVAERLRRGDSAMQQGGGGGE